MGLKEVTSQIIAEAESRAAQLQHDAKQEADRLTQQNNQELKEYEQHLRLNAKNMINAAKVKEIAAAEFEGKKVFLDKKKEIIDSVMTQATERLQKCTDAERKALLKSLLKQAKKEIDVHCVLVSKKDEDVIDAETVKVANITGGLIAENKDSTISVDLSFDTLIERVKQDHLRDLSEVLFK
jgi:V/A-type H+/Na+-transporting ATPase subunit E